MNARRSFLAGLLLLAACGDPETVDRARLVETLQNEPDRAKHIAPLEDYAERQAKRRRAQAIADSFARGVSNGLRYPSSSTVKCTTTSRKGFSETTCRRW